jgi:hypothetical protein
VYLLPEYSQDQHSISRSSLNFRSFPIQPHTQHKLRTKIPRALTQVVSSANACANSLSIAPLQAAAARTATGGGPAGSARRGSSVGLDISVDAEDEGAGAQVADGAAHHGQARARHDRLPEVKGRLQQPVPAAAERAAHASGVAGRVLSIRPDTTVSQSHRLSQLALHKRSTRRVGQGWVGRVSWAAHILVLVTKQYIYTRSYYTRARARACATHILVLATK